MRALLGTTVTDRITGFKGVVTGSVTYISGCSQALVQPAVAADGALRDSQWLDEQRLVVDATVQQVVLDNGESPGFDKPAPVR